MHGGYQDDIGCGYRMRTVVVIYVEGPRMAVVVKMEVPRIVSFVRVEYLMMVTSICLEDPTEWWRL